MKVLNPNLSTNFQTLKAVVRDRVLVNLSIKALRQSVRTGKDTASYCTELKQHNIDKTHIGELVNMCLRKI
jgi:hypothetical protein